MGVGVIIGIIAVLIIVSLLMLRFPPHLILQKINADEQLSTIFSQLVIGATNVIRDHGGASEANQVRVRLYLLAAWYWYVNESNDVLSPNYQDVVERAYWDASEELRLEAEKAYKDSLDNVREFVIKKFTAILAKNPTSPSKLEEAILKIASEDNYKREVMRH